MATGVLWIVIPYTRPELAKAALRHAAVCSDLDVHVCLVDVQVVPFPCPLNQPPIDQKFSQCRLNGLLKEADYLAERRLSTRETGSKVFARCSSPGLWSLSPRRNAGGRGGQKLARTLKQAGHDVMFLPVVR